MKCGAHSQLNLSHTKEISDLFCAWVGTEDVGSSEKNPSLQFLITVIPLPQVVYLAIVLGEKLGVGCQRLGTRRECETSVDTESQFCNVHSLGVKVSMDWKTM